MSKARIHGKETPHKEQNRLLRNKAEMPCFSSTDFFENHRQLTAASARIWGQLPGLLLVWGALHSLYQESGINLGHLSKKILVKTAFALEVGGRVFLYSTDE